MEFVELWPEEKLCCALFGEPAWPEGVMHFLSDEGRKAVNDLLDEFVAKHHDRPRPYLGVQPASRTYCERGVKILRLRCGVEPRTDAEKVKPHSSDARTLQDVAPYLGVTRERIRQIEAKTLRLLRHPVYRVKLRPYLEEVYPNV